MSKSSSQKQVLDFNRPPLPQNMDDVLRYLRDLDNELERFVEAANRELNKKKDA